MPVKARVKQKINSAVLSAAKRSEAVDTVYRRRLEERRRRAYQAQLERYPEVDSKTVVFNSFGGRGFNDSPKAIFTAMINDPAFDDWNFIWVFKPAKLRKYRRLKLLVQDRAELGLGALSEQPEKVRQLRRMTVVRHNSARHYSALARAKYWVSNQRTLDGLEPTPQHEYIQTWHGTPFKRLGVDVAGEKVHPTRSGERLAQWYRTESQKWTYTLAQNQPAAEWLSSAFQLDQVGKSDIMNVTGYPRNDKLLTYTREDIDRIYDVLKLPRNKKIALYTPTYRDDQHTAQQSYVYQLSVDFTRWKRELGDDWIVLFRPHYLVAKDFDFASVRGFVYNVASYEDINDLFLVSDLLINDYSSTMFDYANLRRPIMFYCYDLEHYEQNLRGFYFPSSDLPGQIMAEEGEVIEQMQQFDEYRSRYQEDIDRFAERFAHLDDGQASRRVIDAVFTRE